VFTVRPAGEFDLSTVSDLLVRANDTPYDLAEVIGEKLSEGFEGSPRFGVAISPDGTPVGAAVICGPYLRLIGVDRSARRRGAGSALLAWTEEQSLQRYGRIVVAAEPGNYLTPGVFAEDSGAIAFFRGRGYREKATAVNLIAEMENDSFESHRAGVRRAAADDCLRVIEFVRSRFGSIWAFETRPVFRRERPTVVVAERDDEIVGFSAWCANNAALGTYGPSGVAPEARGRGIGSLLLEETLHQMYQDGFRSVLIQWAAALPFYEIVAGASVAHRFVVMEKVLGSG
jgi:mycothiol synthase